jgi:primosomal protein N'
MRSTTLMRTGYGTERVVKELAGSFPRPGFAASIPMWADRKNVEKTLRDFHDGLMTSSSGPK